MTTAPIARTEPGPDPYRWLEQRDAPDVLAWLQAENQYLETQLADVHGLRQQLFGEIRGRIRESDLSLPGPRGRWLYYQRTRAGDEYPRYYRCPRPADGSLTPDLTRETLLLDPNRLADPDGFFSLGSLAISPDHQRLAWSCDCCGDEIYQLHVLELASGTRQVLPASRADGSLVWAADSQTLFWCALDDSHRPHRVYRHRLGETDSTEVFHEADGRFFVECYRSSSERQLVILSASKTTSEAWVCPADQPEAPWQCLAPRETQHEYAPDHGWLDGQWCWLIRSNQSGLNFALFRAPEHQPGREHWQEWVAHHPAATLEDFTLNAGAITLSLRENGQLRIEVRPEQGQAYQVQLPDAVYSLHSEALEFDSPVLRLHYESLNRPAQIRQLQLASGEQCVLRETPVEGGFRAEDYVSQRLWACAPDGTRIPVSLVARPETLERPAPLYLYGYGAYGDSLDPWFSHARLSLLDRGFIFAIAHVRGGGDLGEAWYQAGKLAHKNNSFSDFIACAEHLLAEGYTRPDRLVISGASAGGLLVGAVLNQRPELFAAAIAEVPFVDVLNTMSNPELPLTVTEYDEWGDPGQPEVRERLRSYSPYDNVRATAYPALLATAGYHDSRVQYWEAAKWVARLRATRTDDRLTLLKTEFSAGHGGQSGRYQALQEVALEYAFLLKVLGRTAG